MAWSIPTYAGTRATGDPSPWRTAMFQLCRAVNERQGATAVTKTQFYKADGTLASDISLADIDNIFSGGTGSYPFLNLKKVRDAILAMITTGYYTETSGGTVWTKGALETAIGTDLDADPIRPQEARFWQAMQDALDSLIYVTREVHSGNNYNQSPTNSNAEATIQDAWDARADNSGGLGIGYHAYWAITSLTRATVNTAADYDFVVPAWTGTQAGGAYQLQYINQGTINVDWAFGGQSGTITSGTSGTAWFEWSGNDLSLNATTSKTIQLTTSEPGTVPFSSSDQTIGIKGNGNDSFGRNALARFYINLASVLTDQA